MRTETLELALHRWDEWTNSIENARRKLDYAPDCSADKREAWWESRRSALLETATQALTHLSLPKSFAHYWSACLISDYRQGKTLSLEKIRWPLAWVKGTRFPSDPVPPGCWRVVVKHYRYYRGDEVVNDPRLGADSFRVFPPPLASVVIPRWAHPLARAEAALDVVALPRDTWRESWKNRSEFLILVDFQEDTNFAIILASSSKSGDSDLKRWKAEATIEMPTWAVSDDLLGLVHEQLQAIRIWQEGLHLHPMSTLLKRAAAATSKTRGEVPPHWDQWLQEYQQGEISYQTLVERVYRFQTTGRFPRSPAQQPPEAKKAADWVRKQLIRQQIPPGALPRYWWRNLTGSGSQ
jgi:hypothetical protein